MTTITDSITKTLGTGSGIDTKALVTGLVEAQFATKTKLIDKQTETLTAQISSVAKLKSGITGFSEALKTLVNGGALTTQPTSSNAAVATVALRKGASSIGLSAQLTVERLASAQAATSNAAIPAGQAFRAGTLTVKLGTPVMVDGAMTDTVPITVAEGATVDRIAAQIQAKTGLQTQLVNDNGGVRLTIKGGTGAAQAFEITGADTSPDAAGRSLSTLSVGAGATGMTIGTAAADAVVTVDGARYTRPSNTIGDLLPGVDLRLASVSTTPVTLGTAPPGGALTAAIEDVVATFNELKKLVGSETNSLNGSLRMDPAAAALNRALSGLTLTKLATSTTGGPQTLADLGVATEKDGTLRLDTQKLATVMARNPAGVEAIFAVDAAGKGGLSEALSKIATAASDKSYGLDAATGRYTRAQDEIGRQKAGIAQAAAAMTTRLTQQYAVMDARVAAYKATQTFMEQQINMWSKSD